MKTLKAVKALLKYSAKLLFGNVKLVNIDDAKATKHLIFSAEHFILPKDKDVFGNEHDFFSGRETDLPEYYVRCYEKGYCFPNSEVVFTHNKELVIEHTAQEINPFGNSSRIIFYKAKKRQIKGIVAHLSLSGLENNYYHFLAECLGRLYLLNRSGIKPDYYIIANHTKFQKELLPLLGITPDVIISTDNNELIQADLLVVPDLINNWELVYYRGYAGHQKKWLPKWISNIYHEKIALLQHKLPRNKKIFVSRQKSPVRRPVNNDELNNLFLEAGFEIYCMEDLTTVQQIELFAQATHVAGFHGSNLTNMLFATGGGIKLLEIFSQYYHDAALRILAHSIDADYHYFIGKSTIGENVTPHHEDIYVDVAKLKPALIKFISN